jgi:S1-C subfamily serine protease
VDRPDAKRLAADVGPAIVTIVVAPAAESVRSATSLDTTVIASGVVFDTGGWVITNRHVVCGADTIAVVLSDGRRLAGELYGLDSLTDLAIVRVDATGLPSADIGDSTSLRPGQVSVVVGSSPDTDSTTVTSGVVSALGRDIVVADPCIEGARRALRNVIQLSASVVGRSTGGALLDATGSVVGISTVVDGEPGPVAYAIPVNIAKPIMEQATADKPISRPWMGITYTALDPDIAATHGLAIDHGAWLRGSTDGTVPAVVPGGPADIAGLQEGDVLTAIDDQRIDSAHPLDDILSQYRPESQDPIVVSVLRDGAPLELPLMLGSRTEPS